mmetsp:Transcript_10001/g.15786  ORF Transcript_10001/g.15786 Transcript_10001/m.15786 type:complete len:776 (-) Transcript_10001:1004-3331(-)
MVGGESDEKGLNKDLSNWDQMTLEEKEVSRKGVRDRAFETNLKDPKQKQQRAKALAQIIVADFDSSLSISNLLSTNTNTNTNTNTTSSNEPHQMLVRVMFQVTKLGEILRSDPSKRKGLEDFFKLGIREYHDVVIQVLQDNQTNEPLCAQGMRSIGAMCRGKLSSKGFGFLLTSSLPSLLISKFLPNPRLRHCVVECLAAISTIANAPFKDKAFDMFCDGMMGISKYAELKGGGLVNRFSHRKEKDFNVFVKFSVSFCACFLHEHMESTLLVTTSEHGNTLRLAMDFLLQASQINYSVIWKRCLWFWNKFVFVLKKHPGPPSVEYHRIFLETIPALIDVLLSRFAPAKKKAESTHRLKCKLLNLLYTFTPKQLQAKLLARTRELKNTSNPNALVFLCTAFEVLLPHDSLLTKDPLCMGLQFANTLNTSIDADPVTLQPRIKAPIVKLATAIRQWANSQEDRSLAGIGFLRSLPSSVLAHWTSVKEYCEILLVNVNQSIPNLTAERFLGLAEPNESTQGNTEGLDAEENAEEALLKKKEDPSKKESRAHEPTTSPSQEPKSKDSKPVDLPDVEPSDVIVSADGTSFAGMNSIQLREAFSQVLTKAQQEERTVRLKVIRQGKKGVPLEEADLPDVKRMKIGFRPDEDKRGMLITKLTLNEHCAPTAQDACNNKKEEKSIPKDTSEPDEGSEPENKSKSEHKSQPQEKPQPDEKFKSQEKAKGDSVPETISSSNSDPKPDANPDPNPDPNADTIPEANSTNNNNNNNKKTILQVRFLA